MKEFYLKLTDGTISGQKPDGKEIVSSMQRARITAPGIIEWSEKCFCSKPLKHERETIYDHFLKEIETELVTEYVEFEGKLFIDFLDKNAGKPA